MSRPSGNTIAVGIDFGTTYSGVAFSCSTRIERIEVISTWDSQHINADLEKTPTSLAYDDDGNLLWGHAIPFDLKQLRLPEETRKSTNLKESRGLLQKLNLTTIEAITIYPRELSLHADDRISKSLGYSLVHESRFNVIITLPAIWPTYAQDRMMEDAREAGILDSRAGGETQLTFISEPEAATLATLTEMALDNRCDLENGDTFVVADCGDGTADLISYEMVNTNPMRLRECVRVEGNLCGAIFVDEKFTELLKHKLDVRRWNKMPDHVHHRLVTNEWEGSMKKQFDGKQRQWRIQIPYECLHDEIELGEALPKVMITSDDVEATLKKVTGQILKMVDNQIRGIVKKKGCGPKYLILAGGFGRSRYLHNALKNHVGRTECILTTVHRWIAISRGAVLHAARYSGNYRLSADVQARISRASYGVLCDARWDGEIHDYRDKVWNKILQCWVAENHPEWFQRINTVVESAAVVKYEYQRHYSLDGVAPRVIKGEIYMSKASTPPKRSKDPSVHKLCTIKWDVKVDIASLPTWTNPIGKVYHRLDFTIQMTTSGGYLDFVIYHRGKRQGSQHVVVEFK
ncbi:hypothetical protein QBC38DRAFT_528177 [Podospora fimiseda]|uniref:Actin-like ATPase domain-containing protein n=1 Tax=Podospora fimiseda TaxID=252190 RepID=A0AAN7H3F2_9PEZI|nr:hypothetical protein QBC38DRAFT_528177 [Podospora fimiseda]